MITIRFNSSNLFEPKIYDESNRLIPFFKEIKKECMIIWVKTYKIRFPINLSPIKQLMLYFRYRVNVEEQNVSIIIKQKICKHLNIICNVRGTNKNINDKINRRQNLGPRYNSIPGYQSNQHQYLDRIAIKGNFVLQTGNVRELKQNSDDTPLLLHVHIEHQDYSELIYNILETKKEIKRLKISYENEPNESVEQKISILQKKKRSLLAEQHYFNYLNFSDKKNAEEFYKKMGLKKLKDGEGPSEKDWDDLYNEMLEYDKKKAKEYKKKMGESKLRTQVCISVLKGTKCPNGKKCTFAHTIDELVVIDCRKSYKHDHQTCKYKHKDESWGQFYCKPVIGLAKDPRQINKMIDEKIKKMREENINPYIKFKTSKKQLKKKKSFKKQKILNIQYDKKDIENIKEICFDILSQIKKGKQLFGRHQTSRHIAMKIVEELNNKEKKTYKDILSKTKLNVVKTVLDILIDRLEYDDAYLSSVLINERIKQYKKTKEKKTKRFLLIEDKIYDKMKKLLDKQLNYSILEPEVKNKIQQNMKKIAEEASKAILRINYNVSHNPKKSYKKVVKKMEEEQKKLKQIEKEKQTIQKKRDIDTKHNIPLFSLSKLKIKDDKEKEEEIPIRKIDFVDSEGFKTPKKHIKRKLRKIKQQKKRQQLEENFEFSFLNEEL